MRTHRIDVAPDMVAALYNHECTFVVIKTDGTIQRGDEVDLGGAAAGDLPLEGDGWLATVLFVLAGTGKDGNGIEAGRTGLELSPLREKPKPVKDAKPKRSGGSR